MNHEETHALIERYAAGPTLLRSAYELVPREALQWRPEEGKWSVHEVIGHCADSETMSSMRIRFVVCEDRPIIQGYDQDRWASASDYHAMPIELALRQVEQVREWTVDFLRRLPQSAWSRTATHTESGAYSGETWLGIYARHLEEHARQIERNLAAWNARSAVAR